MHKLIEFVKNEAVLAASAILAVISSFFVKPDLQYAEYLDIKTLAILFSLMAIMAGLKSLGVFETVARNILKMAKNVRMTAVVLVLLCFFSSMLITNDVALITFVPLAITAMDKSGAFTKSQKIFVIVMQTVAANLGSMLTPMGNPQNLYLYTLSGMSIAEFLKLMLPYTILSLLMILIFMLVLKTKPIQTDNNKIRLSCSPKLITYLCLFVVSVAVVCGFLHYAVILVAVLVFTLIADRKALKDVDFKLLMTFAFFFVFIGNMGRMESFCNFIASVLNGREVLCSVAASQVISNVPCAILLSGFTENITSLVVGTNIGGLGTLIASMASLISYKYYCIYDSATKGKYIIFFSIINLLFLAVLLSFFAICRT